MKQRLARLIALTVAAGALTFGLTNIGGSLSADPSFGPGNQGGGEGNESPTGPADPKCHPPGQTVDVPGCK
jgi:hypothetical protein